MERSPCRGKHFAAITDPEQLGVLLRAIKSYKGGLVVRAALQLAPCYFSGQANCEAQRGTKSIWKKRHGQSHLPA